MRTRQLICFTYSPKRLLICLYTPQNIYQAVVYASISCMHVYKKKPEKHSSPYKFVIKKYLEF